MFHYSVRTLLIACSLSSVAIGLYFRDRWQPRVLSRGESCGTTQDWTTQYGVMYAFEWRPFDSGRLLCVRVIPAFTDAGHSDLEMDQVPIIFQGEPVDYPMSCIHLILGEDDVWPIPLDPGDAEELEQITSAWMKKSIPRTGVTAKDLEHIRAASPANSLIWKSKIEPEIQRQVRERNRARLAARGSLLP